MIPVVKLACGQRCQPILNVYEYEKWCHWNQISHFVWKRERGRKMSGKQKSVQACEQASMEQDTIW